jgi:hypothetical protein
MVDDEKDGAPADGRHRSQLELARQAVMRQVSTAPKDGANERHHYRYATEAGMVGAVRDAMVEAGLSLTPSGVSDLSTVVGEKGSAQFWTQHYLLRHVSGEGVEVRVRCGGWDSLDKQPYKGLTGAYKYALRQCFLIEVGGEDPEEEEGPPADSKPPAKGPDDTPRGFRGADDRKDFLKAIHRAGVDSEAQCDLFITWMRFAQKNLEWPENLAASSYKFRRWFVGFMRGERLVGTKVGAAWFDIWRKSST